MDLIAKYNEWIEQVENLFTNPQIPDTNFDIDTINQIIKLYYIHSKLDYETKRKNVNSFKLSYINQPTLDPDQKICLGFNWDLSSDSILEFCSNKQALIKFINKSNPKYFETVFGLIKSGKINFNLEDIKQLTNDFFSYVGLNLIHRTNRSGGEDYLEKSYVPISGLESFFVNILVGCQLDQITRSNIIKGLGWMGGSGDLEFAPSGRVKKFSGDLIPQISQYYSENFLSPFVSTRTNLGIVINNSSWDFYPYNKYIGFAKKISCSELRIEFPHMCWVWVEYVEIEYIGLKSKPKITAKPGYDYLLKPFRPVPTVETKSNPELSNDSIIKQICKIDFTPEEKSNPCVYIKISIPNYEHITNIKVFGQALILI